jgi:tetratricopeptide (TPR) repeat protein
MFDPARESKRSRLYDSLARGGLRTILAAAAIIAVLGLSEAGFRGFLYLRARLGGDSKVFALYALGGSTTHGAPFGRVSFPSLVRALLSDQVQGRPIDVRNLSAPGESIGFQWWRLRRAAAYRRGPGAVLIYAGVEARLLPRERTDRAARLWRWLERRVIVRSFVLTELYYQALEAWRHKPSGGVVPYTMSSYDFYLRQTAQFARANGLIPVFSTVFSNMADMEPNFEGEEQTDPEDPLVAAGRRLEKAGRLKEAIAYYTANAAPWEPLSPYLYYRTAKCWQALARYDEARESYWKAVETDTQMRFPRPIRAQNILLRRIAAETGALLTDSFGAFQSHSPHGLIGRDLIIDFHHPTLRGYHLLARGFAEALGPAVGARLQGLDWDEAELRRRFNLDEDVVEAWLRTGENVLQNSVALYPWPEDRAALARRAFAEVLRARPQDRLALLGLDLVESPAWRRVLRDRLAMTRILVSSGLNLEQLGRRKPAAQEIPQPPGRSYRDIRLLPAWGGSAPQQSRPGDRTGSRCASRLEWAQRALQEGQRPEALSALEGLAGPDLSQAQLGQAIGLYRELGESRRALRLLAQRHDSVMLLQWAEGARRQGRRQEVSGALAELEGEDLNPGQLHHAIDLCRGAGESRLGLRLLIEAASRATPPDGRQDLAWLERLSETCGRQFGADPDRLQEIVRELPSCGISKDALRGLLRGLLSEEGARWAVSTGQFAEGLAILQQLAQDGALRDAGLSIAVADGLQKLGRRPAAVRALETADRLWSDRGPGLRAAELYLVLGEPKMSLAVLKTLAARGGLDAAQAQRAARLSQQAGDMGMELVFLKVLAALQPAQSGRLVQWAGKAAAAGRPKEALAALDLAGSSRLDGGEVRRAAELYRDLGAEQRAWQLLKRHVEEAPQDAEMLVSWARWAARADPQELRREVSDAAGHLRLDDRDRCRVLDGMRRAGSDARPEPAPGFLARIYRGLGPSGRVGAVLRRSPALWPADPGLLLDLAEAAAAAGDRPAAVGLLARARRSPLDPGALGRAALVYQDVEEYGLALPVLDRLVVAQPAEARWRSDRGGIKVLLGDRAGGAEDLDAALALDPGWLAAYLGRGSLFDAAGDRRQALRLYETALRQPPSCPTGNEALRGRIRAERERLLGR